MNDDNTPQTMAMQQLQSSGQMSDTLDFVLAQPNHAADRIETMETMLQCMADGRIVMLARIEALEKECFGLAANQCNHGYGDEYGHFRCLRIEALEAALRGIIDERDGCVSPGIKAKARAALAPEDK